MAHEITHGDPAQRQLIADQIAKMERQSAERRAAREPFEAEESAIALCRRMAARDPLPEYANLRDGGMVEPDRWPSGWWLLPGALIGALIWGATAVLTAFGGN